LVRASNIVRMNRLDHLVCKMDIETNFETTAPEGRNNMFIAESRLRNKKVNQSTLILYRQTVEYGSMKHPKRQSNQRFNGSLENKGTSLSGTVGSMIGKDTFSLTFNINVATALNFEHKESLRYEVVNDRLIIMKSSR
jgi:hypothetical protein